MMTLQILFYFILLIHKHIGMASMKYCVKFTTRNLK